MATTMEVTSNLTERSEEKRGEMHVLNSTGDTKIMWDRRNRDEVETARRHFRELREKHYLAFRAEGREGTRGEQITEFDPDIERIIMVPRSVGG